MDEADLEPRKAVPKLKDLETLSVQALEDYILELEAEIDRARAAIRAKKSARGTADAVFKK